MNAVVVDATTRARLLGAGTEVEVRNESGELLGRFTKLTRVGDQLVEGDWPSDGELDRRKKEGKWYGAAEVEERFRKMKEALG
jgi:hypothetical protein